MENIFSLLLVLLVAQDVVADSRICGHNSTLRTRSCSTQILGEDHGNLESCKVEAFPPNSSECSDMTFGPFVSNNKIGSVSLKPYMLNYKFEDKFVAYSQNYIVLNITFTNIKWNSMKFRFQRYKDGKPKNHCRSIVISQDVAVSEQSVLYYDCYWSITDRNYTGQTHILDFEASDMKNVNRGRFLFNIPSESMLSTDPNIEEWRPFTYIEFHTSTMRLHILPPPTKLGIQAYHVQVLKECDKGNKCTEVVRNSTIKVENSTSEVVYDYDWPIVAGSYYFLVTPLHKRCVSGEVKCLTVESPRVPISSETQALNICIASITALIVATLFAYYIVLRVLRRFWCKDYSLALGKDPPAPPCILVVYSNKNKLHVECVASFVTYLRSECGFDIIYDNDVINTTHGDPYVWADEAFNSCTHVAYIVPPSEDANLYNNIYDQPIKNPHKNVDTLLLSMLRTNRASKTPKEVINIFFEYSNGQIPVETRRDKKFYLLKDWQKMVSFLSKNLVPTQQLMRTEKGRCFLEDLKRAKKMLSGKQDDVIFKCEKLNSSPFEKKVLL